LCSKFLNLDALHNMLLFPASLLLNTCRLFEPASQVNFTGSPGRFWRLWLPYAEPSSSLLLHLNFGDTPDRRYLWSAAAGRIAPRSQPPSLTDGSPGGSYYWDQVGACSMFAAYAFHGWKI
jgi:hypothetical protein